MTDPLTTNLQFAVPSRGSDVGTWDTPNNGDWAIADAAFGSVSAIALSNVNVTLTITQAQSAVLRFSGALSASLVIFLPAIQKFWTVENNTTGNFFVVMSTGLGNVVGLPPGEPVQVYSDGTNMKYLNLGRTGMVELWYKATLPDWVLNSSVLPYLVCDGSTFSAVTYPALNTFLGGNTLPDLRGRSPFGLNLGTGRVSAGVSGIDGDTLGSGGGFDGNILGINNIPAHSHTGTTDNNNVDHNHAISPGNAQNIQVGAGGSSFTFLTQSSGSITTGGESVPHTHTFTSNNTGGGQAHNNMAPTLISGIWVIKT